MKKYKPKKMLRESRFRDLAKSLSKEEYRFALSNIDQLLIENKEYVDEKNYGYLCNLLSSIALVWMYEKEGKSREESQKLVLDSMYEYLKPKIPSMQWIAKHRWFVPLLKKMMPRKSSRTCGYGWKITYPEAPKNTFSMVTHSCIFAQIFSKYGMPEMTKGFCMVDNLMYDRLPKTKFFYTQRIGEGGQFCDYSFQREETKQKRK